MSIVKTCVLIELTFLKSGKEGSYLVLGKVIVNLG